MSDEPATPDAWEPSSFEALIVQITEARQKLIDVSMGCDFALRSGFAKDEKTERDLHELQKDALKLAAEIDNFTKRRAARMT